MNASKARSGQRSFPFLAKQAMCNALLEHLHDYRRIRTLRFADQQVNMLGHHDEADHIEPVPASHLLQHLKNDVPRSSGSQERLTPIATRSNEVEVSASIESAKRMTSRPEHGAALYRVDVTFSQRTLRKPRRVRHPHFYGVREFKNGKIKGRPPVLSKEERELIFRMVAENSTWGAPRIHGELLKLGFDLSERTIARRPFADFCARKQDAKNRFQPRAAALL